jgi:peptide/nickel transport system permease protein
VIPYLLRRLIETVPVVVAVVAITFALIHTAPGDPVLVLSGQHDASPQFVAEVRRAYGLDRPLPLQLLMYLGRLLRGDFGQSISFAEPVLSVITDRLPATLLLIGVSTLMSLIVGTALGVVAARRPGALFDSSLTAMAGFAWSLPIFWLAQLLMLVFSVWLGWFPTSGIVSVRARYEGFARVLDVVHHLVLPATTIFLLRLAVTARLARSSMVEVLHEQYIVTARAKGLAEARVIGVHALRNAIRPVITATGTGFGTLVAGTVLTETVFAYPGLGRLLYDAILARDYPLLMGLFVVISVFVVLVNLATDVVYGSVDPRARLA